jgi:hypothetical protein
MLPRQHYGPSCSVHSSLTMWVVRTHFVQMREGIGNSNVAGLLEEQRRLVILNGTSSATPQGALAPALKGAVGASLVTHKSPFRLSVESGRPSRLEASAQMVRRWLFNGGWVRLAWPGWAWLQAHLLQSALRRQLAC